MDILGIVGIGVLGAALAVLLKQYKPEYAVAVSLIVGVVLFAVSLEQLEPVLEQLDELMRVSGVSADSLGILVKSLGICFLTQIACDTCRDAGQGAIASKVEIAGKLTILLMSMPLFGQLLEIVSALLAV